MMKKISIISLLILMVSVFTAFGQQKTVVKSNYAKKKLLGRHFVSLQWISQDYLGRVYVKRNKGLYSLKGEQKSRKDDDYLKIEGIITEVNRYNFKFTGTITQQVSYINNGEPCVREGDMTFAITGKRKYWRLQNMKSPCDTTTDYVDIYFRK